MITLTTTALRNLLQLPERPYEDAYSFDGTSYWDLSQREACTIFSLTGTVNSSAYTFRSGIDWQLTAGSIDWTLPGANKPDFGTPFVVDYTYSRLGGNTASTSVANAIVITTQDLGSSYPYASTTTSGVSTDTLAAFAACLVAARDASLSLSSTEIDIAQKSRRGAVLLDDSKKTTDWLTVSDRFASRYKQYLTMVRPAGMVRAFSLIRPNADNLLLGEIERRVFDNLGYFSDPEIDATFGGIL